MTTRAIKLDDLFRLMLVGEARISPDGRAIAYVVKRIDREKNDYLSSIYIWEDGASRPFTGGLKDASPRWSPDGRTLAFLSRRGEGKTQIYLMSVSGGEAECLTDVPLGAGIPIWSPDGKHIAFCAPVSIMEEQAKDGEEKLAKTRVIERAQFKFDGQGLIEDRRTHIFVVDVEERTTTPVTHGDYNHADPTWAPDGEYLAFAADRDEEWDLRANSDVWIVHLSGGTPRRVTRGGWVAGSPVFSPDGATIAFVGFPKPVGEKPANFAQLWSIPRGGGDACNLLEETDLAVGNSLTTDWSTAGENGPMWTDEGIYFLVSSRGSSNVYRIHDGLHPVTEGRHDVMDFSVTGGVVACTVSSLINPPEVALVRDSGLEIITNHNANALADLHPIGADQVSFEGAEGETIDGWLMKPDGFREGITYPVIVYIHGGPTAEYGETFFHEFQTLAGNGFGVFYCNPHGSTGHGRAFQTSIRGDWGNLDYRDMMAALDRLLQESWVDPHRVGVAGGSYGGFMVNWIVGHTDRFAAACTQRSICNMVSQGGISDWAATRGEALGATPENAPEHLWNMSPLKFATKVRTPTLIIHSERDDRCPIAQGEEWFMALKRQRIPVRFVRFPEESHGLSRGGKPSRRVERIQHILDWFNTYL